MLPNFLIIGAQKSGSTSLYRYLRSHPQIFMPLEKELQFFMADGNWWRGEEWYRHQFRHAGDAKAIGEATPGYTMYPLHAGVPQRIAQLIPKSRLLYVVRDPIERMRSHYHHRVVAGREHRPIAQAFKDEPAYLDTSRYALQIEQYLRYFSREQLLVLVSERLRENRAETLRTAYEFLGVDPEWSDDVMGREWNVSTTRKVRGRLISEVLKVPLVTELAGKMPEEMKAGLRLLTHHAPKPVSTEIPVELERTLRDALREDTQRLQQYVPMRLEGGA